MLFHGSANGSGKCPGQVCDPQAHGGEARLMSLCEVAEGSGKPLIPQSAVKTLRDTVPWGSCWGDALTIACTFLCCPHLHFAGGLLK